jgi:hypothetical protein
VQEPPRAQSGTFHLGGAGLELTPVRRAPRRRACRPPSSALASEPERLR